MIKSFKHKGLQDFFESGSMHGIQPMHAEKIYNILFALNNAVKFEDINLPGFRLHALKGDMKGFHAVTVQANWRITFKYDKTANDVYIVDYQDYH